MQNQLIAYIELFRPKQWTKNLLVFAALLFVGGFNDSNAVLLTIRAFFAMCLLSSATYVFNDLRDRDRDRLHPRKKHRPIASGKVAPTSALVVALVCLVGGLLLAMINTTCIVIVGCYLVLQALYNLFLKQVPVADVFCIAIGFVLRAVLGAAAITVTISGWLLFCTGALALLLGFSKRRNEFLTVEEFHTTRASLAHYTKTSLDFLVAIFACGAAMCYGIYSIESDTAQKHPGLILTSVFVFYGIARYVLIVFSQDEGGEPENIFFKDKHILMSVVLFIATAILAMSGFDIPLIAG